MITVHAEVVFRTQTRADADRILTAIADIVMVEIDGAIAATATPEESQHWAIWHHPHMEGR